METWKEIKGYEGKYLVSDKGNIYSKNVNRNMSPGTSTGGYSGVALSIEGNKKMFDIHRIVATHFIDNPDKKKTVNHKDYNKSNNCVANLEWMTISENITHSYLNKDRLKSTGQRGKFGEHHNRSKTVFEFDSDFNLLNEYGSGLEFQRKTGISHTSVSWAIKHKRPIFGKYYSRTNHFEMK